MRGADPNLHNKRKSHRILAIRARSSVGECFLDAEEVVGSIPSAPTIRPGPMGLAINKYGLDKRKTGAVTREGRKLSRRDRAENFKCLTTRPENRNGWGGSTDIGDLEVDEE